MMWLPRRRRTATRSACRRPARWRSYPTSSKRPTTVAATTLQEVLAIARARPGTLNFGSTGNGSPVHLVLERMKQLAHVDIVHAPYKGAALALQDILAGQIELTAAGE